MKRITMLVMGAVTCLCFLQANGQTTIGVKGGVNIADITEKYTDNGYHPRVSGHGGIYVNRMLNKYFGIQPEILFSGEGQQYSLNAVEHTWALNYIQIPLMLQVYPIQALYLEAGPQIGLLVSARDKVEGADHDPDISVIIPSAKFSIATGIGFRIADRVVVYGRYNFGFTDITSHDAIIHRNNVAQVGVAIRLKTL